MGGDVSAGASAQWEVTRSELRIAEYLRLLEQERNRLQSYQAASRTERRIGALLDPMCVWGWHLLPDRRWPGTRAANIDLIHVGPGGVLVIDVKSWADPRIEGDRLMRGDADASDEVDKLLRVTALVEDSVAELGLTPLEVRPILVFAGRRKMNLQLGRVQVLGEPNLVPWIGRLGSRLTDEEVTTVAVTVATAFPPYERSAPAKVSVLVPEPVVPRVVTAPEETGTLFDVADLEASLLEAALKEPIESWMTFLHPEQVRQVRRSWNGPARVRGPAGTGKTVVGLHRTAYLAKVTRGPILYTSFVRTLPRVLGRLYERLSPETVDRVEFLGLHAWAVRLLSSRHVPFQLDAARAETLYWRTWSRHRRNPLLGGKGVSTGYWREEIDYVIKGRGLTDFSQYAELARVGRRMPLQPEQREAVWDLYQEYDGLLRADGVHDFNDVLLLALQQVRADPVQPEYVAVVADEVQDLNCVGAQILHTLVGDRPDGLLLIGDGQQAVYPGGFTLAEAGVSVTGRSVVLRTNYRNTAEILDVAAKVVEQDGFDDLEGITEDGHRAVEVHRTGGQTIRVDADTETSHDIALVARLKQTFRELEVPLGDMAILTATRALAHRYLRLLAAEEVAAIALEDYEGASVQAVKVGTFKRAKGLEFKHVFIPLVPVQPSAQIAGETDTTYRERLELERRELYVGMTRARDCLWLGYVNKVER